MSKPRVWRTGTEPPPQCEYAEYPEMCLLTPVHTLVETHRHIPQYLGERRASKYCPECEYKDWCPGAGSNHRHRDFQSRALPTELPGRREPAGRRAVQSAGVIEADCGTVQQRPRSAEIRANLVGRSRASRAGPRRLHGRRRAVLVLFLLARHGIDAGQPAIEVDVGAALGAERPERCIGRLAADRAAARSAGIGIGPSSTWMMPASTPR